MADGKGRSAEEIWGAGNSARQWLSFSCNFIDFISTYIEGKGSRDWLRGGIAYMYLRSLAID